MKVKLEQFSYSSKKERQRKIINTFLFFILIFILINLVISYLLFPVRQVSTSMSPDLPENSLVLVTPLSKKVERGDVILLTPKDNKITLSFFQKKLNMIVRFFTAQQINIYENNSIPGTKNKLRRVVGMPGDTIYMRDYILYVKPAGQKHFLTEFEITDQLYNVTFYVAPSNWDSSIGVKGSFDEIILGENEYFVLGDNRKSCDDSRIWGTVTAKDFKAKTVLCYFPFKNIKLY